MKRLLDNVKAAVDIGLILMIGIAFAGIMMIAYIIWTIRDLLRPEGPWINNTSYFNNLTEAQNTSYNMSWNSFTNITGGFDNAVNLLIIAITIFILAIAIAALLMLRGRQ